MKNTSNTVKKILQFLYLPITNAVILPLLFIISIASGGYGLSVLKPISIAISIFLGGFLFSKIKDKKIKISSSIFTVVLFILFGLFVVWSCEESDQGGLYGLILLPITYGNYFKENTLSYILLTITAPLPVLISALSSLLYTKKNNWTKIISIFLIIAIAGVGVANVIKVFSTDYETGFSYFGNEVYFDVKGNEYNNEDDVLYYDKQGNEYHIEETEYESDDDPYSNYTYMLIDEKGNKIDLYHDEIQVYLSADGYIFIDENESITFRDDIPSADTEWEYCDENGNIYAMFFPHSFRFLRDGTPLSYMGGDEYRTK